MYVDTCWKTRCLRLQGLKVFDASVSDHTDVTSCLSYVYVFNIRASAIAIPLSTDLAHVGHVNFFYMQSNPDKTTSVDTTPRL